MQQRRTQVRAVFDEVFGEFPDVEFSGEDPDDYHVHAAARACNASYLLTDNRPPDFTTGDEPYEIITADDFFETVGSSRPTILPAIIVQQMKYWSTKPRHRPLDDALARAGCPKFASRISEVLRQQALITYTDAGADGPAHSRGH